VNNSPARFSDPSGFVEFSFDRTPAPNSKVKISGPIDPKKGYGQSVVTVVPNATDFPKFSTNETQSGKPEVSNADLEGARDRDTAEYAGSLTLRLTKAKPGEYSVRLLRRTIIWNNSTKNSGDVHWYVTRQDRFRYPTRELHHLWGSEKTTRTMVYYQEKWTETVEVTKAIPRPVLVAFVPHISCDSKSERSVTISGWIQVLSYQGPGDAKPVQVSKE
jgi:hypothetical protein